MNIVFAGTPDFAARHLNALIQANFNVVAVYTQPDRPANRGKKLQQSAVKELALAHKISIEQPPTLKDSSAQQKLASYQPDVLVVVAYGLLLPKAILDIPSQGCINVHGSILPKWRGAAPIQRAIWAGDSETGVTTMLMDEGLDTGPILEIATTAIEPTDTSASMYEKLADIGPKTLVNTLKNLSSIKPVNQDNSMATHAKKLSKEEAKMDWSLSAAQLERNIRAFNPWPCAWFEANGKAIKVWQAQVIEQALPDQAATGRVLEYSQQRLSISTVEGILEILELQLPGKKRQSIKDVKNGNPDMFAVGTIIN